MAIKRIGRLIQDSFVDQIQEFKAQSLDSLNANIVAKYLQGIESDGLKVLTNKKTGVGYETGGHIHEAVYQGVSKLTALPESVSAVQRFEALRSYDEVAARAGRGKLVHGRLRSRFLLTINLFFAVKLEYGGTVRPMNPGGRKRGEFGLYSRRSSRGTGWLIWDDGSGNIKFGRSYTFSGVARGVGALRRAIDSTDDLASQLGWKRK